MRDSDRARRDLFLTRIAREVARDGLERRPRGQALLTVRDVAKLLKVNPAMVYRLVEAGELPHVRVSNAIRFHPSAISEFSR